MKKNDCLQSNLLVEGKNGGIGRENLYHYVSVNYQNLFKSIHKLSAKQVWKKGPVNVHKLIILILTSNNLLHRFE